MATEPNFEVHDQRLSTRTNIGLNGVVTQYTTLTYWVGEHGPFKDEWPTASFTPQLARDAMAKRAADTRTIFV